MIAVNSQQQANNYALKLISDADTLQGFSRELAVITIHAQKYLKVNPDSEDRIQSIVNLGLDYYFQPMGFSVEELIKAQKMLAAHQLYFWTGTYYTQLKNKKTGEVINKGTIFTVASGEFKDDAPKVSYGTEPVIGLSLFKNMALNWTGLGLSSQGNLTFSLLTNSSTGKVSKALFGSYTDINGVDYELSGFEYDPKLVSHHCVPVDTSTTQIKNAFKVVNYLAISTFMLFNLVQISKLGGIALSIIRAKLDANNDAYTAQGDAPTQEQFNDLIPQGEISLPADLSVNPPQLSSREVRQIGDLRDEVINNSSANNAHKNHSNNSSVHLQS